MSSETHNKRRVLSSAIVTLLVISSYMICIMSVVAGAGAGAGAAVASDAQAAPSAASTSSSSGQAAPKPIDASSSSKHQAQSESSLNHEGASASAWAVSHRHGRSVSSGSSQQSSSTGGSANNNQAVISNSIETSKYRFEQDRKQLMEFFTPKNVLKSLMRLVWGSKEEVQATSRQMLSVLAKVLEMLKGTFGQKARSVNSRGFRDTVDDMASASLSMLQGYIKAVIAPENCAKKYLCQASKDAVANNHEVGTLVTQVAGLATSYLLDAPAYKYNYDAIRHGRQLKDCSDYVKDCPEDNPRN